MKKVFLICGNYGAGNLGDELILKGMQRQIRTVFPGAKLTVLSAFPRWTEAWHGVSAVYPMPFGIRSFLRGIWSVWGTLRAYAACDAFVLGGGGLLTDEESSKAPLLWAYHVWWALLFRKPIYVYANSIGPFQRKSARRIARWVLRKATVVTVRDEVSLAEAQEMCGAGREIGLTADPIFFLQVDDILNKKSIQEKDVIFIGREGKKWKKSLATNSEHIASIVQRKFGLEMKKISILVSRRNLKDYLNKKNDQLDNILQGVAAAKFIVTSRLHGAYLALIFGKPFVGFSEPAKIAWFLREVGLRGCSLEKKREGEWDQLIEQIVSKEVVERLRKRAHAEIQYLENVKKKIDK